MERNEKKMSGCAVHNDLARAVEEHEQIETRKMLMHRNGK